MKKNTKIVLGVTGFIIVLYFLPIFGVEKSAVRNEIAKSTREPVLGKAPVNNTLGNLFNEGKIDFVDEKNLSHYIKEDEIKNVPDEYIVQESIDWVDPKRVKNISKGYYDFIQKNGKARYFKPNFDKLFNKKVGDKVTLVVDNEEFTGFITKAYKEEPNKDNGREFTYYNYYIHPELDVNSRDWYKNISIHGSKEYYSGTLTYSEVNGGIDYEFKSDGKVAIILPLHDFQSSLNLRFD